MCSIPNETPSIQVSFGFGDFPKQSRFVFQLFIIDDHEADLFSYQLFAVAAFTLFSISMVLFAPDPVFAEKKITQNQNCEIFYSLYKDIGESKFRDRYQKIPRIFDCLKLYKNPNWNFQGKGETDQYFDSLKSKQGISEYADVKISILSKNPTGKLKYVIKFEACSNQIVSKPYFLIKSDGDRYLAASGIILQGSKCSTFRAEINTISPRTIQVEYVDDPSKYENLKTKRLSLV